MKYSLQRFQCFVQLLVVLGVVSLDIALLVDKKAQAKRAHLEGGILLKIPSVGEENVC